MTPKPSHSPTAPASRRRLAVALMTAAVMAFPAPLLADRETDRLVAGAIVLGVVGLAIANQNDGFRDSARDLAGPSLGLAQGTIDGPIHITPPRPLYTGPGGVPPGTRSDPLAGLGPLDAAPQIAGPLAGTVKPGPVPDTIQNGGLQNGARIAALLGAPDGPRAGAPSTGMVLAPLSPAPGPTTPVPPVTVSALPPAAVPGQTAPAVAGTGPVVPLQCLVTYDQGGENLRLYEPECLAAASLTATTLPVSCAVSLRTLGRFVSGYDPVCLSAAGYTLAGVLAP